MNSEKILEVIYVYKDYFLEDNIEPLDFIHGDKLAFSTDVLSHCCGMVNKIEKFVVEGRKEKAFRWLGFMQGCLWSLGIYSLDDLKNHNRPKEN